MSFQKQKPRKTYANNPHMSIKPVYREPSCNNSSRRAERIAESEKRAAELSTLPNLPKGLRLHLHSYSLSSQSRDNCAYLNSLLSPAKAEPKTEQPKRERRRVGARHRINGVNL